MPKQLHANLARCSFYEAFANKTNAFRKKRLTSLLIDVNQLPELHQDFMAFVLRETEEEDEKYIVITQEGIKVWKEILAYEYYGRFIEIGKLLKQKYGDAMIDLVPDTASDYLYGDSNSGIELVLNFRKELRRNIQSK